MGKQLVNSLNTCVHQVSTRSDTEPTGSLTKLLPYALKLVKVCLILLLVLDLLLDALEHANSGRVVVDAAGGTDGGEMMRIDAARES